MCPHVVSASGHHISCMHGHLLSHVVWPFCSLLGVTIVVLSHNVNNMCAKDSSGPSDRK